MIIQKIVSMLDTRRERSLSAASRLFKTEMGTHGNFEDLASISSSVLKRHCICL